MKQNKTFAIEWGNSRIVTFLPAENEEDAITKFKAGLKDEFRDDPDIIVEVREL